MANEVDVVVPVVGESVSEGAIGKWFFKDGDVVHKDDTLFELDSDKASMEVPATESGRLKIMAQAGETVLVGATVGKIDTSVKVNGNATPKESTPATKAAPSAAKAQEVTSSSKPAPSPASAEQLKSFTPSQRKAIRHGDLRPEAAKAGAAVATRQSSGLPGRREPMSSLRKTIAKRLLQSQQSTATLTTFNEVDMSAILQLRKKVQADFQKKEGVKLGFMSFFTAAVVHALREYPIVNAFIDGEEIVHPDGFHMGIAVSTDKGLVVPVLRHTESLSYAGIEKGIASLAEKARDGKLSISEMQGGSFTITNGGIFGSLLSTPILNPPQSGILGMHKTEHRPIAIEKADGSYAVEVRPMMYLALSYDHRVVDGATSVGFLVKVKEYLEKVGEDKILAPTI
jgi:2-oxoglutarate dehydrogenase E2 component (dihydrolipoamide succinyltransferase)